MTTGAQEWIRRFAGELGTDAPGDEELNSLLGLAGVAAHGSERTAAPISCWLAGRAGVEPSDALAIAERLAGELATEDP
ncbi:MAG: DUF6457 domain-containing protein [Acidimicrobiales bacterium]